MHVLNIASSPLVCRFEISLPFDCSWSFEIASRNSFLTFLVRKAWRFSFFRWSNILIKHQQLCNGTVSYAGNCCITRQMRRLLEIPALKMQTCAGAPPAPERADDRPVYAWSGSCSWTTPHMVVWRLRSLGSNWMKRGKWARVWQFFEKIWGPGESKAAWEGAWCAAGRIGRNSAVCPIWIW